MIVEMKVPSPGESITEVQIARWIKKDGDFVDKDEDVCEIDSDKATLTLAAEESGKLKIIAKEGETIAVGSVVCTIDTEAQGEKNKEEPTKAEEKPQSSKPQASQPQAASKEPEKAKPQPEKISSAPAVIPEKKVATAPAPIEKVSESDTRPERREKMSMLRKRISERLVAVKQQTAMLTTFNEVDMSAIMDIRKQHKEKFKETYGVSLGFISFFTKAVCEALHAFPTVNAQIGGDEIIYHDYCDIGIAVSAPKGLMVPVIRNAETLAMHEIEQKVFDLAAKARDGKISIEEMTGGTFTITNGGVFGSMLSTPIINPPQSAILGMHNIVERPVAINGEVVIRPIMYVALSYDHRIIDGRESVSFLMTVKQLLEQPEKMLFDGKDPFKILIGL